MHFDRQEMAITVELPLKLSHHTQYFIEVRHLAEKHLAIHRFVILTLFRFLLRQWYYVDRITTQRAVIHPGPIEGDLPVSY